MSFSFVEAPALAGLALPTTPAYPVTTADPALALQQLPPGLANLGNSCYINSVLQTLASSRRFCAFLEERSLIVRQGLARASVPTPLPARRPVGRHPSQPLRGRQRCSTAAGPAAAAAAVDAAPWAAGLAAAVAAAAEEVIDAAGTVAAPLLEAAVRVMCRAVLWLQGLEPTPLAAQKEERQQGRVQHPGRRLRDLSELAAAACAPLHAAAAHYLRGAGPTPPTAAAAAALHGLASGTLLQQLDVVLRRLQPRYSRAADVSEAAATPVQPCRTGPVDPSALLAALRNQLPESSLRLGQQNDAAEALACLCNCLDAELTASYMVYGRWIQTSPLEELAASVLAGDTAAVAAHTDTAGWAEAGGTRSEAEAAGTAASAPPSLAAATAMPKGAAVGSGDAGWADGRGRKVGEGSPQLTHLSGAVEAAPACVDAAGAGAGADEEPIADPELTAGSRLEAIGDGKGEGNRSFNGRRSAPHLGQCGDGAKAPSPAPSRPPTGLFISATAGDSAACRPPMCPLRGLLAASTTCCECGGMSVLHVEPFWSLQLPLPQPQPQPQPGPQRPRPSPHTAGATPSSASTPPHRPPPSHSPQLGAVAGGVRGWGAGLLLPSLDPTARCAAAEGRQQPSSREGPRWARAPSAASGNYEVSSRSGWGLLAPRGAGSLTLHDCLALTLQPEAVEGVECCRCSLQAALRRIRAAAAAAAAAAPGLQTPLRPHGRALPEGPVRTSGADVDVAGQAATWVQGDGRRRGDYPGHEVARGDCSGGEGTACGILGSTRVGANGECNSPTGGGGSSGLISTSSRCGVPAYAAEAAQAIEAGSYPAGSLCTAAAAVVPVTVAARQEEKEEVGLAAARDWCDLHVARLQALLSGPHLPDLDLDREIQDLQQGLMAMSVAQEEHAQEQQRQGCSGGGVATAAAIAASMATAAARLAVVRTRALRRTRVARCPPVLALQLMRTVWDSRVGAAVKDGRHVVFPLELGLGELELLGILPAAVAVAAAAPPLPSATPRLGGAEVNVVPPSYLLTAVVVHYGGAESGHYLMYRRVATALATPGGFTSPAKGSSSGGSEGGGRGGGNRGGGGGRSAWLRVSDSSVSLAGEEEVLQQAAAILMYEQQ